MTAKRKKALAALVFIALAAAGLWRYYSARGTGTETLQTAKAQIGDVRNTISATGTLKPVNSVDVSSKVTGRIVEVRVRENDMVREGDILFLLDSQEAKSDLARDRATLDNAWANLERTRALLAAGAVSRQAFDSAQRDYLVAKASYDTTASRLDDTVITAPVSGLVVGKPTPAGQTVAPGISAPMVLMTIADMSVMQSETLVDESDIGQIKLDQKVEFTVDAYPDEVFEGVVSLISRKAQTENNVIYYKVYVDVLNTRGKLFPDMTSRVNVLADEVRGVLSLPVSSVRENKTGNFVYKVLPDGRTEEVKVTVGLRSDERVEIKSGLAQGDAVLLRASGTGAPAAGRMNMRGPRLF